MKTLKLYLLGLMLSCNASAIIPENVAAQYAMDDVVRQLAQG